MLVFLVGQRQRRGHRDRIAGVDAHRIDILNRADDDAVVGLVADNLHLEFFPAEKALVDQDLRDRRGGKAGAHDLFIFLDIIRDTAACPAERIGGPDNGWQAHFLKHVHGLLQTADPVIADDLAGLVLDLWRGDDGGARVFEADPVHRLTEEAAVLSHLDGVGARPDQLHTIFLKDAVLVEVERAVQRGLAAHCGQDRVGFLALDDLFDEVGRDRFDIGRIRHVRVGHDCGGVRVHQDDPVAFILEGLDRLDTGIVELASLTDNDGASTYNEDGFQIGAFWHLGSSSSS